MTSKVSCGRPAAHQSLVQIAGPQSPKSPRLRGGRRLIAGSVSSAFDNLVREHVHTAGAMRPTHYDRPALRVPS